MLGLPKLLHLCYLPLLAEGILQPPRNLSFTSENFKHTLTWEEPNTESAIFYNVEYRENNGTFQPVTSCSNITNRYCDLTKEFSEFFKNYEAHVESFTSTNRSGPSPPSPIFTPIEHTVVGPPIVDVVPAESGINVTIGLPVSYLWNKKTQSFDPILMAFPSIDYNIYLEPSAKVPIFIEAVHQENITIPIPSLSPSTTYCVTVIMDSENMEQSIPSPKKCTITKGPQEKADKMYWIGAAVILLIFLVLLLILLDQAGYISRKKIFPPRVLESLPHSRRLLHEPDHIPPPMITNPLIMYHSDEQINEHSSRQIDSAPYIAHHLNAMNGDHQEAMNQERSWSSNGVPMGEHSVGPLLDLTGVVQSAGPNVQTMMSIGNNIPTTDSAAISLLKESMEVPGDVFSAGNLLSSLWNGFDDSPKTIHLNSVSLVDSDDLSKNVSMGSNDLIGQPNGEAVIIRQFTLLSSVLSAEAADMDNLDHDTEEVGDKDSDLNCASNYIKR
ncbi:uncharacterized protein [Pyxicephalus adspersus]|uniref:uncharacterized protein isoform X2 n=1 Tax=Pyxicephalus adspersus TaxID=30357 RepID=UPI003B5B1FBC